MGIFWMAACGRTGLFYMTQISWISNHPLMGRVLGYLQGFTEMAGAAAQDPGIMGWIKIFCLFATMAAKTHLDLPTGG